MLKVYKGEVDWVIAESAEQAAAFAAKEFEYGPGEGGAAYDWAVVPDDHKITIHTSTDRRFDDRVTKTAQEWITEYLSESPSALIGLHTTVRAPRPAGQKNPVPGLLCSSEY